MTFRVDVKTVTENPKEKKIYDRANLPPYLSAATLPKTSTAVNDALERGEGTSHDTTGEADVAAGEIRSTLGCCVSLSSRF
jgi:hypothetical protein